MNLFTFLNRQKRWSTNMFGPAARTEGVLRHIEKEIAEVRADPGDLEEWVDIAILALDGAWRAGHTPHDICAMLEAKQARNMKREYPFPDSDDEPSEHVREPLDFETWWKTGYDAGLVGPPVCATHDGIPTTAEEDAEEDWSDVCVHIMRPYDGPEMKAAVEANHSPSVWRASNRMPAEPLR